MSRWKLRWLKRHSVWYNASRLDVTARLFSKHILLTVVPYLSTIFLLSYLSLPLSRIESKLRLEIHSFISKLFTRNLFFLLFSASIFPFPLETNNPLHLRYNERIRSLFNELTWILWKLMRINMIDEITFTEIIELNLQRGFFFQLPTRYLLLFWTLTYNIFNPCKVLTFRINS